MKVHEWIVMIACCMAIAAIGYVDHLAMDVIVGLLAGIGMRHIMMHLRVIP